jgi:hypothetical protein
VAGHSKPVRERLLDFLASATCGGVAASSLHDCIANSTLCSDRGQCVAGVCQCNTGFEGDLCQYVTVESTSSVPLDIILGTVIPVSLVLLLLLVCLVVGLVLWARHNRRTDDDWEVDMGEIELGEQLGAGGFGVVNKAVWKGTEVAVKMMTADANTRELERNFKEEVGSSMCNAPCGARLLICSHVHSLFRCAS